LIEPVCGRQILFSPRHGTEVRRGSGCREWQSCSLFYHLW
jgi:hypothetical protein